MTKAALKVIIIFFSILLINTGCKKDLTKNCTEVTVTLTANSCKRVGIILSDGTIFPCDDLPDKYAVDGNKICILFNFWNDLSTCACCGGTKISIIAVG
jgi:hypothetical protein